MFSPAITFMAAEFKETNETILSFSVSIYLLGYTVSTTSSAGPQTKSHRTNPRHLVWPSSPCSP
jgi:hypothetical protein